MYNLSQQGRKIKWYRKEQIPDSEKKILQEKAGTYQKIASGTLVMH